MKETIVDFLRLCHEGHTIEVDQPEAGVNQQRFDCQHQLAEWLKRIAHARRHCITGK